MVLISAVVPGVLTHILHALPQFSQENFGRVLQLGDDHLLPSYLQFITFQPPIFLTPSIPEVLITS